MAKANSKTESVGRFAYDGLDRVIHEKARLSVLTSLVAIPRVWSSATSSRCAD